MGQTNLFLAAVVVRAAILALAGPGAITVLAAQTVLSVPAAVVEAGHLQADLLYLGILVGEAPGAAGVLGF